MQISVAKNPRKSALKATISGSIVLDNSQYFEKDVIAEAFDNELQLIGFDLSGVTHMDSSGMGTLIRLNQEAKNRQKRLVIIKLSPALEKLFQIAMLDKVLEVKSIDDFAEEFSSD